jgi:hypothetical protein
LSVGTTISIENCVLVSSEVLVLEVVEGYTLVNMAVLDGVTHRRKYLGLFNATEFAKDTGGCVTIAQRQFAGGKSLPE